MMYEELMFHLFITCAESMDRVHEIQLFEERTKGSEHKDWRLKSTFIGC